MKMTMGRCVQAKYSVIDFDFFEYSQLRWKQYYASLEGVLELVALAAGEQQAADVPALQPV